MSLRYIPGGRQSGLYRADGAWERRWGMEPEHQELPMPMTSKELIVLIQCLKVALKSEEIRQADKEVIRKMAVRIDRYAERQGAYWEK
jgi:hypothetical protein